MTALNGASRGKDGDLLWESRCASEMGWIVKLEHRFFFLMMQSRDIRIQINDGWQRFYSTQFRVLRTNLH